MKFYLALWLGKIINLLIRMIDKSRGSNLSGEKAIVVDPQMIKKFKGVDCSRMLFITGTNGKSTTNNLVYHIFRENGYDVVSNLEGANLMAGIATALIKRSSIFGRIKGDFFIFEVDERYLASVYALLPAENILVTNLQKDQVHRNGDPDFIYRKISPVVEKAARVFLNGDEPRSFALSSLNPSYVTYGVEKHSEAFMKDGTFPTMACPVCHGRIEFDYYNNDGMGGFRCLSCGLRQGEARYRAEDISFADKTFTVDGTEFNMPYDIPYMLYNYAAAIAVAREMGGIPMDSVAGAFKNFKNVGGRYEVLEFEGKTIKYMRIKQENPETLQTSLNIIAQDKTPKTVCLGMGHIPDVIPSYTNTFYTFDCDFSGVTESNVEDYMSFTEYVCYDVAERLIYAGVPREKIKIMNTEDGDVIFDAVRNAKTDNIYLITWIHTFHDLQKKVNLKEKE
ncbi:MAG: MurT ligase domain-containing protein [Anaerovoracaceae bacterium]